VYKSLVRTPLQQAMSLLWLVGAWRLGTWAMLAPLDGKWVVSAGASALLLMLIGLRLRLLIVVPVWLGLGWCTVMAGAYLMGIVTAPGIALVTTAYALLVWHATVSMLSSVVVGRLADLLSLRGGYPAPGGRFLGERTLYWTSLALTLFALFIDTRQAAPTFGVPAMSWPVLTVALLFLLLSGRRYALRLNTYLAIVLVVLAIIGVFATLTGSQSSAIGASLPLTELSLGLLVALSAAFALSSARLIAWRALALGDHVLQVHALYATPLRNAAVAMALLAILQVLMLAQGLAGPAWKAVATLAVSSVVLLLANRELRLPPLTAIGAFISSLALCWFYGALMYGRPPWGLWPGGSATGGEWLLISLLALLLATTGYRLETRAPWRRAYGLPLLAVAGLAFGWSLVGALDLYAAGSAYVSAITVVLIATIFPLLRSVEPGAELRGIGVALLMSFLLAAALGPEGRAAFGAQACLVWAFALWVLGTLVLPSMNARLRDWSVVPRTWPWLGLIALVVGIWTAYQPGTLQWHLWVITGVYLFLLLRQNASPTFAWLGVGVLSLGVVLFSADRYRAGLMALELPAIGALALHNLLWANVLLVLALLWDRHGARMVARLGWRDPALHLPLLVTAFAICTAWLLGMLLWDGALVAFDIGSAGQRSQALPPGTVLALSLLHGLLRWRWLLPAHLFIAAVFATALAAWGIAQPFHLPLAVVLFAALVAGAWMLTTGRQGPLPRLINEALRQWLAAAPGVGLVLMLAFMGISIGEQLGTLALLAGIGAFVGWRQRSRIWLYAAGAFTALLLHGVWLIWIPWARIGALLPVYALQFAVLTSVFRWLSLRARSREDEGGMLMKALLPDYTRAAAVLSVCEWGTSVLTVATGVLSGVSMSRLSEPWGHAATLATAFVLGGICVLQARRSRRDRWVYATAALVTISAVYCRVLWVGTAPVSVWDTAAIIAFGYALFALQAITGSRPTYILTMTLPLAVIFTMPLQPGSTHAGLSLFALGALYMLTRRSSGQGTPLYLGLLAINAGIYLWVPDWASRFGLLQAYIIPAALTVLFLLHLHRNELKPAVLNGARLGALNALYATATLDVFLQEGLWTFMLALVLSFVGVVLGIVSRTRAFLYAGTAFLVINVLGQLVQLYPEQRLDRALVLMGLGAAVTAGMIGFNLKREAILQSIRIVRADLASWD
jgi:hypothetical protein